MNLPNKLTVMRMLLIPVFLMFYFVDSIPMHYLWSFFVFAAASITDLIDGKIARKYNMITDFGKLMDPLADKLLVMAALCSVIYNLNSTPFFVISLILILSREFLVTSIRLLAAGKGQVLAADMWGKIKTVLQMAFICMALLSAALVSGIDFPSASPELRRFAVIYASVEYILFIAMVAVTVLSGFHYIIKNRKLFEDA